jgi:signal transduction histidine kinase
MSTETVVADVPATSRRLTIAAWSVAAVTTGFSLTSIVLEMAGPGPAATSADPEAGAGGVVLVTIQAVGASAFAILGSVVVSRQPRNPVGWLLVLSGFFFAYIAAANELYLQVVLNGGDTSGINAYVLWVGNFAWLFAMVPVFTFLPLLFPTGRPLTPRWRPVVWFVVVAISLTLVGSAFKAGPLDGALAVDNPLGIDSTVLGIAGSVGSISLILAGLASIISLVLRFRRSTGTERQQIKWVASAAALFPIAATGLGFSEATWPLLIVALVILAIAVSVSMLRYRLYDIDVVINKALVFALLAGFITSVYAAIVVGLGRLLPIGEGNLGLAIAATALVAVAFEPVRVRVQHWANRLVYGHRATPYEALAAMTGRIGAAADPGSALPEAARLLAEGTGAAETVVWVAEGGMLVPRAVAGDEAGSPEPMSLTGDEVPERPGALMQPVRHEGRLVGALSLSKRPGEGASSADRQLLEDLAGQAALLLANTRLRTRLSDRLVELRTSRQRMLVAQDRARHALERDLHDGAQQELVALKVKLGLARTIAEREGASDIATRLADAATVADQAVDTLRDVARGIYPPLLESEGLAAALSAQARRSDLAVTVLDRTDARYARDIEATAFFCVREAVRNAAAHADAENAHVELTGSPTSLTVIVSDDGRGFDPEAISHGDGLTHMYDRADAAGGSLEVASRPGHGATITLTLPASPN